MEEHVLHRHRRGVRRRGLRPPRFDEEHWGLALQGEQASNLSNGV